MRNFIISVVVCVISSCGLTQDPCPPLHDWNYTDEWYYKGGDRFQVYQTRFGKKFIYDYNRDSTAFRRYYISSK